MKKRRRLKNEVSAGSMADIAFLLLIFFLVTTTIDIDKGIQIKLPPFEKYPPPPVPPKNILVVKINAMDELLVEGEESVLENLKEKTIAFISNPEQRKDLPSKPKNAIISLQHDRATSYGNYISVYNELKAAYNELWEEQSQSMYNKSFKSLKDDQIAEVKVIIPFVISESEPTDTNYEL